MPILEYTCRRRASSRRYIDPYRFVAAAFLLPAFVLADDPTSSASQFSEPFLDQVTGLQMQRFFGARTTFAFAFSLPETQQPSGPAASFIGQMTFPLVNGEGWGALGLTGEMEGNFILAAWPDGNGGIMASFRQATDEDNPPEVAGTFQVRPIPDGVQVNETFLTYTFLCENCLDSTLGLGLEATAGDAVMGWALSERQPLGDPADPGAQLGFHERGFGPFTARLGQAKAAGFEAVAARAAASQAASARAVAAVPGAFTDGSGEEDGGGEESGDEGGGMESGDESGDDD
ncbi:hypothetical protein S40285_04472 [Stachybotrys chlorohalonatus IBT 40285]|uniref:Cellobiose dehydrogenase-like cytochrome domain-containing protein n=1 Tax=Stachybotrys chlorohalonatus (strain IBT 40285) TaxID=1283841 RepID=A0A084QIS1_STAC4|nr:hypothetical protein S40285_04472 [Stachybotrys chlorohalonata IBT 40285]